MARSNRLRDTALVSRGPRAAHPTVRLRLQLRLPTVLAGAVLAGAVVTGCADPTGAIDDQGHNGYDAMTCEQAKAFALDVQYGTVYAATVDTRISELSKDAAKASQPEVQRAAKQLITGYRGRSPKTMTAATASLVQACQM